MYIGSPHNLPIITVGSNPPDSSRAQHKHSQHNTQPAAVNATPSVTTAPHQTRRTINVQPMFDQNLTHRGEQARRAYQGTELNGEAELLNRLDVTV